MDGKLVQNRGLANSSGSIEHAQEMRGVVRIRFVGGPWHNKLVVCKPLATFLVKYIRDIREGDANDLRMPVLAQTLYHLRHFETDYFETPYAQYVHESLIDANGLTHLSCEHEVFDTFKLKRPDCKRK